MDKRITLKNETVKKLKVLAAHEDIPTKNYIEKIVENFVTDNYEWLPSKKKSKN